MRFVVTNRKAFLSTLALAAEAMPRIAVLPVLRTIRAVCSDRGMRLHATDLGALTLTVEAEGVELESLGEVLFPLDLISFLRKVENSSVSIEAVKERLTIEYGKNKAVFPVLPPEDFPRPSEAQPIVHTFPLDATLITSVVRKVAFATAKEGYIDAIKGIHFSYQAGCMVVVATDGKRLARLETKAVEGFDSFAFTVYPEALKVVAKFPGERIDLAVSEETATFRAEGVALKSKLAAVKFPDVEQLWPGEFANRVVVGRDALRSILDRSTLFMDRDLGQVIIAFGQSALVIGTEADGRSFREVCLVERENIEKPLSIGFDCRLFLDGLKCCGDQVTIHYNDSLKPVVLDGGEGYQYLIMPMRMER